MLTLSQAAVNNMIKSGGFVPLDALEPLAIPVLKALGISAVGHVGSNIVGNVLGNGYKKGNGFRLPGSKRTKHYGSGLWIQQGGFIGPFSLAKMLLGQLQNVQF